MSKVTIQGDASGTGIFTIASPNSNTDRTLVLPDEAGTVLTDRVVAVNASAPDDSVVVDASGNVGINISDPTAQLHINRGSDGNIIQANGAAMQWDFILKGTNGTTAHEALYEMGMYRNDGTASPNTVLKFGRGGSEQNGFFAIDQNGTEALRINSSGSLLAGTTSAYASEAYCGYRAAEAVFQFDRGNNGTLGVFRRNGTLVGSIGVTTTATSYNTSSDYRLKEDWVAVANASTRVNALKPVNFAWIASGERVDGFLAHELAEVVPEAVTGEKDAVELVDIKDEEGNVTGQEERPVYQGIDQSKLVPLLTAALQEALARIETLEADVATLKGTA